MVATTDQTRLRALILELLQARGPAKTICPSDAARALAGDSFRPHMDGARAAAAQLVAEGLIEVTQRGEVVDIATARGPIRLGLASPQQAAGHVSAAGGSPPVRRRVRRR